MTFVFFIFLVNNNNKNDEKKTFVSVFLYKSGKWVFCGLLQHKVDRFYEPK